MCGGAPTTPLCTLPAPHRTSSPYNHRLLETLNLNGLPFVSPMSTENVRRLVRNVARQLGAPVAAQRALGLGLTNHFHEPRIHQPLAHEPLSGVDSAEGASAHHHHLADRGGVSPPPPLSHPHAPHHPTHRHRQGRRPAPPTPPLFLKRWDASHAMTSPCTTRFRGVAMAAHRRAALPTSSDAVL